MEEQIVYLQETPVSDDLRMFADEPDVMDVPKVAEILGVAEATVRREIARGRLESIRVGTCVRVTKNALLRYIGEEVEPC